MRRGGRRKLEKKLCRNGRKRRGLRGRGRRDGGRKSIGVWEQGGKDIGEDGEDERRGGREG